MTSIDVALQEEAHHVAQELFGNETPRSFNFVNQLLDICTEAQGKDFLIVHNPGGWGQTKLECCQEWERSIVMGLSATVEEMGYSLLLSQYFRTYDGWRGLMGDMKEQTRFFAFKATVMAAWLRFIIEHVNALRVILVGVSQGAAFSNAVMQKLGGLCQVYSIEMGFFFPYRHWRVITERTLAVDNNGVMPDPLVRRDLWAGIRAFIGAPFRWSKYRLEGRAEKFSYCINVSGHEYSWDYPEVRRQVIDFLEVNFGTNRKADDDPA